MHITLTNTGDAPLRLTRNGKRMLHAVLGAPGLLVGPRGSGEAGTLLTRADFKEPIAPGKSQTVKVALWPEGDERPTELVIAGWANWGDQVEPFIRTVTVEPSSATQEEQHGRLPGQQIRLVGRGSASIATDGAIWAITDKEHLVRFAGTQWDDAAVGFKSPPWRKFQRGVGGAMLVEDLFYANGKTDRFKDLKDLIRRRRADVAAAFPSDPAIECDRERVFADRDGNVLVPSLTGPARVLTGEQWAEQKIEAGFGECWPVGVTVGGGEKMVFDQPDYKGNSYYFTAEVQDGRILTEKGRIGLPVRLWADQRDADGGWWHQGGWFPGPHTHPEFRLTWSNGEKAESLGDRYFLTGLDGSGVAWLAHLSKGYPIRPSGPFDLWRMGKVLRTLNAPDWAYNLSECCFISDRPGSVIIWNKSSLAHYVADDPKNDPGNYQRVGTYTTEAPFSGHGGYSKLGYLATWSFWAEEGGQRELGSLRLFHWPPATQPGVSGKP